MALSLANRSASSAVGDESFEQAVLRLREELVRWAEAVLGLGEGEDAVQSALFSAWKRGTRPLSWDAWLRTILINEMRDRLRARRRLERRAGGPIESLEERRMT